jgi:hypothetical protein
MGAQEARYAWRQAKKVPPSWRSSLNTSEHSRLDTIEIQGALRKITQVLSDGQTPARAVLFHFVRVRTVGLSLRKESLCGHF